MIILLIVFIMIYLLITVYKKCFNNGKFIFNHYFCITVGYIYYGILPVFILEADVKFRDYTYYLLLNEYNNIPRYRICIYLFFSFFMYLSFILGSDYKRVRFINKKKTPLLGSRDITFNYSNKLYYAPITIIGVIVIYLNRASLFTGYTTKHSSMYKGTFSGFVIMVCSILLLYIFSQNRTFLASLKNIWFGLYLIFAVLLLTMGGRLYVTTNIVAFLVCYTVYKCNGIKLSNFVKCGIVSLLIIGFIGVVRIGSLSNLSIGKILFNILQEPLYTSYSLITYLRNYEVFNLFSVPVVLLGAFVNLIPTVFFPGKKGYIISIYNLLPLVKSPLGATHYFVSYNADFGLILSGVFFFCMGYCLGGVYKKGEKASIIQKTVYCLVSSNIMFTLYRDGFSTSLIKNILEFSIIIPVGIIIINNMLAPKI